MQYIVGYYNITNKKHQLISEAFHYMAVMVVFYI